MTKTMTNNINNKNINNKNIKYDTTKEKVLKKYFGYSSFRPGQDKVIDSILNLNDTLAIMPTGAGKSICYEVPSMVMSGITLVISPLIALMKDQVDNLNNLGIKASYVNSSMTSKEIFYSLKNAREGKVKLKLYGLTNKQIQRLTGASPGIIKRAFTDSRKTVSPRRKNDPKYSDP